jgi:F420-non-reducing hydrogenase small subunit
LDKPKVAILWLGGCGGCDETIVDINETILDVVNAVELVLWPVALDFKYHHIEKMADGEIALGIINGNVRNSEQAELAHLMRKKSQVILAFGACACFGGTPGLANLRSKEDIFNWVYREAPTVINPKGSYPQTSINIDGKELTLPNMLEKVYALDQVIDVDYYLPGCPPPPDLVLKAITAFLENTLPAKGSSLASHKALCDTCPRNASKPNKIALSEIKRIHEVEADPTKCFLSQGIICMGPATRSGCGESCINVNIPCRGCFGPIEMVEDSGAKFLSGLASMIDVDEETGLEKISTQLADAMGYFYRFSLPISVMDRNKL